MLVQSVEALHCKPEGHRFNSPMVCNPSSHNMALGLTQPLTETSTRNISWGLRAVHAKGWQPYHLHVPIVTKSRSLNLLDNLGLYRDCFTFTTQPKYKKIWLKSLWNYIHHTSTNISIPTELQIYDQCIVLDSKSWFIQYLMIQIALLTRNLHRFISFH
jgi:hypothetical protein